MFSTHKSPNNTGKAAAAAAVGAAVVACAACCIPLVAPLGAALLTSLGVYSVSDWLANGWWPAAALLAISPLVVWLWRKRQQRAAPPACATACSCKTAGSN